jgi:very-short-patch-repair endonuclease
MQTKAEFRPETSPPEVDLLAILKAHTVADWQQQKRVQTPFVTFYLDIACQVKPDHVIGIECDGSEFHKDKLRDFCRDALILASGEVSCIYRLGAWAVNRPHLQVDWLWILSLGEPELFTADKRRTIDDMFKACVKVDGIADFSVRFNGFVSRITRKSKDVEEFIAFANGHVGKTFPQLVELAKASGRF